MRKALRRSVIFMLTFIIALMMSGGVLSAWAFEEMGQYQFAAKIVDEEGSPVSGVVVKGYEAGTSTLAQANQAQYAWQDADWQDVVLTSDSEGEIVQNVQKLNVSSVDFKIEDEKYESETVFSVETESGKIVKVNGEAVEFDSTGFAPAKSFVVKEKSTQPAPDPNAPWGESDFTVDETGQTVTGLTPEGKEKLKLQPDMVIPDQINGVDITAIGDGVSGSTILPATADKNFGTFGFVEDGTPYPVKTVKFPAKLEKIGKWAFSAATSSKANGGMQYGLTAVEFPSSLTTIDNFAFQGCPLTSVRIPSNLTTFGNGIFSGFDGAQTTITSVTFDENPGYDTISNGMFSTQTISDVVIPEGIKKIDRNAFTGNKVRTLSLPSTLEEIVQGAFENHQLAELTIPKSVKSIGNTAFRVTVSDTRVETLSALTFEEGSELQSIGNNAFLGSKLESVEIPATVVTLSKSAFDKNIGGLDADKKVLLRVSTEEQFAGTTKFIAEGSGHKVSVEVTFDANGGNAPDPATVKTVLGLKLENLPDPTNDDAAMVFDGWYTDKDGGDKVEADAQYLKNTTVYAHWRSLKKEAEDAVKAAEDAAETAATAKKAADAAKKTADADKAAAEEAAKTPGPDAVKAAEKAEQSAKAAAAAAAKAKTAADASKKAADEAVEKVAAFAEKATSDEDKAAAAALKTKAAEQAEAAEKNAAAAEAAKNDADKAATAAAAAKSSASAAAAKAKGAADAAAKTKSVKTVTVNAATVDKKAINKAIKKAGGSSKYVTKIVLGKKVKKIKKNSFKTFKKVKTIEVKSKKLKKSAVKKSLAGSKVKTVKVNVSKKKSVNKKYVKKYKKIFTKKNAGRKVTVK